MDEDDELTYQIDVFYEEKQRDEMYFLGHFDSSDNQAVCQAIQLQV